ncbi:fungal-specific transcription factor domain-domain-containing protein [Naematelia encephala]|uniref:Fungal-specific transcription factor domain-domain-containing protein n=1 Tax=Naematelia encephala TaxID=71784 RepID=A0A1Y2AVS7_9TREE|nr:fungal-specific transcription factor domain-domain-containing protein [Naematelia encephala]
MSVPPDPESHYTNAARPPPPKKAKKRQALPSPEAELDLSKIRAHAACRACRTKKVKCLPGPPTSSGQPGPCQQCLQVGAECAYPPTRDRAAYSRQYVQNLNSRVQTLEMGWARVLPLLEAYEGGGGGSALPKPHASTGAGPLPHADDADTSVDEGEGEAEAEGEGESSDQHRARSDSPPEDDGQMTTDERGNYRWIGSSNTISLLDSFSHRSPAAVDSAKASTSSTPHDSSNPYFGAVAGAGVVKALPGIDEVSYPGDQAAEEMIDAFFQDVHPCLPVMFEFEFREGYKRLMERRRRGEVRDFGGFISVVFAVFALGERAIVTRRAWQRERTKNITRDRGPGDDTVLPGEAEAGVIWFERAQILHYSTLKDVNIHQVQCLTLLAAFQAGVNAMPMAWLLAGQALRVAQDLGLHRSWARLRVPFAQKQIRSRCWWAIYGLERLVSISLGRPLGVDDLDIDVAYPAEIDDVTMARLSREGSLNPTIPDEPLECTMSGFVALTKLCKIAGRVAQLLYRPSNGRSVSDPSWVASQQNTINKLDKLLREWLAKDVPSKYKDNSATRPIQLLSAVQSNSYFAVLITLHRNFLPSSPDFPRPRPPPGSQSLAHCVDAARSVIHVAGQQRVLLPPTHHLAVACQFLWTSAVVLLLCEVQARDQVVIETVASQVESARRSLQALEPAWPGARKLKELLNEVEGRAKDVVVNPVHVGKKRKAPGADTSGKRTQMGPPPNLQHRESTDSPSRPRTHSTTSRGSLDGRRYETSDTRTTMISESYSTQPYPGAQHPSHISPGYIPNSLISPSIDNMLIPNQASSQPPTTNQPFDTAFDVGGVTFDVDMLLQGFTGADAASFWNTLTNDISTTTTLPMTQQNQPHQHQHQHQHQQQHQHPQHSQHSQQHHQQQQQTFLHSGQNTPNSAPDSTGVSPGNWTYQNPLPAGTAGGEGGGASADLWSQVAGTSFNWEAEPIVPFNV